jgi:hypothetical protein
MNKKSDKSRTYPLNAAEHCTESNVIQVGRNTVFDREVAMARSDNHHQKE